MGLSRTQCGINGGDQKQRGSSKAFTGAWEIFEDFRGQHLAQAHFK